MVGNGQIGTQPTASNTVLPAGKNSNQRPQAQPVGGSNDATTSSTSTSEKKSAKALPHKSRRSHGVMEDFFF